MHHDFTRLPNGNTMVLGWERTPLDISDRVRGGRPGTGDGGGLWCDYFREVTPAGETVWEWHGYEHLDRNWIPSVTSTTATNGLTAIPATCCPTATS